MIAPCSDCGASIHPRGLAQHQRGAACAVGAAVRDAFARGLTYAFPHHVILGPLGVVERIRSRLVPGGPGKRTKIEAQPWAPASLIALAQEMREDGVDRETRRGMLTHAVAHWRALADDGARLARDRAALDAMTRRVVTAPAYAPGTTSQPVYLAPWTVTPEETLRAAGISDARHDAYQRKMSALLAGRPPDGLGEKGGA